MTAPRALALLLTGVTACGTPAGQRVPAELPPVPPSTAGHIDRATFDTTAQGVEESLARLAGLELVTLGQLVVDAPAASHNCYGPCADDPADQAWMQEHARQADRLATLVELAETIAAQPAEPADDPQPALDALRGLRIVEIAGMDYATDGGCYVGFCPGDDERRGRVVELAVAAEGL